MGYEDSIGKNNENGEVFDVQAAIIELRNELGTSPDGMIPRAQVESLVEDKYAFLPVHQQNELVEAFLTSEQEAADRADKEAGGQ